MPEKTLICGPNDDGKRIDRVLRLLLPSWGLGEIFALVRKGAVRVNDKSVPVGHRIREGDRISLPAEALAALETPKPPLGTAKTRTPDLRSIQSLILWEDEDFLVLNKPRGALVHGPGGLDEPVRHYILPQIPPSLAFSPGPLHRLDRNTSGVLFFSKSIGGARLFSQALREAWSQKTYLAILQGKISKAAIWEDFLRRDEVSRLSLPSKPILKKEDSRSRRAVPKAEDMGPEKMAQTEIHPLLHRGAYSLCRITIYTGRTHQIRAQAAARGHPLAGDKKYGGRPFPGGYHLHAWEFFLPGNDKTQEKRRAPIRIQAPLPRSFRRQAERLFGGPALRTLFPS